MSTQLQRDVYNDFNRRFKPQTNFTPQTDFTPRTDFTPQTDFRPQTNFTPQTDFSSAARDPKDPRRRTTAPASPNANAQEDPGAEQRRNLIRSSSGGAHLPFEDDMRGAASKFGVPYEAIYGILNQESSFNPNAKNPNSSATGIGQFIDSTAKKFNIDPRDPKASIYATAQYLRENTDYHQGDTRLGIASHYTGPGKANSPEGFKYADDVSKKMPGGGLESWGPHTATPGSSIGSSQPSLAGMNQDQLLSMNDALSEDKRSIQTIRGNTEGWFNPQQSREFSTLGESMRGIPGGPTYESDLKARLDTAKNTTLENVARIQNQGNIDELNRAAELAGEAKPKSAASVLDEVEGGGSRPGAAATPGGTSPRPYMRKEEQQKMTEIMDELRKKQEEEEEYRLSQLGGRFGLEDY